MTAEVVRYDVTEAEIATLRDNFAALTFDTTANYDEGTKAIALVRGLRTSVEKRRKELKAESLEYGKRVDKAAAHFTGLLEAIEEPLKAKRDEADRVKAEEKRQREEAALVAREAELKAAREAEEARVKAEQEAEAARLAAERLVFEEAKRVADEERARIDAAQAEERARLDAQRAELDAQQKAIADAARAAEEAENRRVALIQAEKDLAAKAERERVETEARAAAAVAEEARLRQMAPEIERLREWAGDLQAFAATAPDVESPDVASGIEWGKGQILKTAKALLQFQPQSKAR